MAIPRTEEPSGPAVADVAALRAMLVEGGRIDDRASLRAVAGGVSSTVASVASAAGPWLAKTPRARLAVADEWFADRSRALREAAALRMLEGRVGPARVPRLRFVDRERMVVGMELIGPPAPTWKSHLLAGRVDASVARCVGAAASVLHRLPPPPGLAGPAAGELYRQLRVDPYYLTTAARVPELAPALEALAAETTAPGLDRRLVHGDLNPKNVLIAGGDVVIVDWELAHVGDPAFDLAMPVAHLLLKAARAAARGSPAAAALAAAGTEVWAAYRGPARRDLALRHVGAVMVARLHGKSPVDYLGDAGARRSVLAVGAGLLGGEEDLEGATGRLGGRRRS